MIVESDGYRFDFTDAVAAFKFDETDPTNPAFHGAPMKAVDVVAELPCVYLFVEVKEYVNPADFCADSSESTGNPHHFTWLKNYLKYKYRDSYLYRYAEDKTDKPVHYLCLLNFDDALNSIMQKDLCIDLPVKNIPKRWNHSIAKSCQVFNLSSWNRNFPKWPVQKI